VKDGGHRTCAARDPSKISGVRALRTYGLLFLVFGIPFGLLTGLCTGWWLDSAPAGLSAGMAGGGIVGGLSTLGLAILDQVGDREARPGEPHGPRQAATVPVRGGPDLPDRIKMALLSLPAEIRDVDVTAGRYTARTKWSWRSFGEEVTVQLTGDLEALRAQVSSRPIVRTTLIEPFPVAGGWQVAPDTPTNAR
jgi:hypothetical protein